MGKSILLLALDPCKVVPYILRILSGPRPIMRSSGSTKRLESIYDALICSLAYLTLVVLGSKIWERHRLPHLTSSSGSSLHRLDKLVILIVILLLFASSLACHHPFRVVGLVEWPDPLRSPFYGISPLAPSQRLILLMLVVVDPDLHGLLVNFRLYLLEIAFVFDALRRALLLSVWALAW